MKIRVRKWLAIFSGLVITAVLPFGTLAAAAEEAAFDTPIKGVVAEFYDGQTYENAGGTRKDLASTWVATSPVDISGKPLDQMYLRVNFTLTNTTGQPDSAIFNAGYFRLRSTDDAGLTPPEGENNVGYSLRDLMDHGLIAQPVAGENTVEFPLSAYNTDLGTMKWDEVNRFRMYFDNLPDGLDAGSATLTVNSAMIIDRTEEVDPTVVGKFSNAAGTYTATNDGAGSNVVLQTNGWVEADAAMDLSEVNKDETVLRITMALGNETTAEDAVVFRTGKILLASPSTGGSVRPEENSMGIMITDLIDVHGAELTAGSELMLDIPLSWLKTEAGTIDWSNVTRFRMYIDSVNQHNGTTTMDIASVEVIDPSRAPLPDVGNVDGSVDENGNPTITANDALMVLQISTEKFAATDAQKVQADVNGDGAITATDALQILCKVTNKISGFDSVDVLPPSAGSEASLYFVAEQNEAGDQIVLSVDVAGLDQAAGHVWNVLEYSIAYDADQVTPVQQNNGRNDVDYLPGDALYLPGGNSVQVNLNTNPVLVGAIDADAQIDNGEIMTIAFELAEGVAAEDVELTVNVSRFAKAIIVDGKMEALQNLVTPGAYTISTPLPDVGDVDGQVGVTANDALMVLQISTEKFAATDAQKVQADVNGDGAITATDALQILCKVTNKISGFDSVDVLPSSTSSEASLDFETSMNEAGDHIVLSVNVGGMDGTYSEADEYTNAWNVLEYNISYDAAQVTPVRQIDDFGVPCDYLWGAAVDPDQKAMIQVNLTSNPVLVGAISADGQFRNGTVMTIAFELADDVRVGDTITLTVDVFQFAKAIIVDGKMEALQNLVTPGAYSITLPVSDPQPSVDSIAVTKRPNKTDYQWGEELDLTGAELTAFCDDGSTETVAITSDMVSGYDPYKIGQQPLTVTYGGRTTTFVVTVEGPALPSSIAVTKQPDKTDYQQGEELDLTGAELTAFYSDGTMETVTITPDMVSGYDSAKIGTQALTVTYKGKTTTFAATVYRPGDVNLDGEVKSEDALMTLQAATHKIELNGAALAANVNGDTEISSSDALQILQYATQKIDSFSSAQEVNQ